jgi:zinc transporter ZupT
MRAKESGSAGRSRLYLSALIAFSIGLHNLGEGLAIGAAFSLGEAALGSFLVIGFTLHNITEGVGIVAPLVRKDAGQRPASRALAGLALLAGFPAVLGAWIGGFVFNPILPVLFLGIGLGAIWQVIVEVGRLLQEYARAEGGSLVSWPNVAGLVTGLGIMYLTAFLVSV